MKKIIVILLLLAGYAAEAQTPRYLSTSGELAYARGALLTDGPLYIGNDTFAIPAPLQNRVAIASKNNKLYWWSPVLKYYQPLGDGSSWGGITGLLSNQTDLMAALNAKQSMLPLGTSSQYYRGDQSLGDFEIDVRAVGDGQYATLDSAAALRTRLASIAGSTYSNYFVTGKKDKTLFGVTLSGVTRALANWTDESDSSGGNAPEVDPTVPAHVKGITTQNIADWKAAFDWGDHSGLYPGLTQFFDSLAAIRSDMSAGGCNCPEVTEMTYAALVAAVNGNTLKAGHRYKITDFQTVHKILGTTDTYTGTIEPLIVSATSEGTLAMLAWSVTNPKDIIHYSLTDNTVLAPASGSKGVIVYRKDTDQNLSAYFDFREVRWRRWGLADGGLYVAFQQYNSVTSYEDRTTFEGNNKNIELGPGTVNVVINWGGRNITIGKNCGNPGVGIQIGDGAHSIIIEDEVATIATAGSNYIGGVYIGSGSRYVHIGSRSYNIAIGSNCYAVYLGTQNSDVFIPDGYYRARVEKGFSNLATTVAIDGTKELNLYNVEVKVIGDYLKGSANAYGIINVVSPNPTEQLERVQAMSNSVTWNDIRIIPEADLTLELVDKSAAGTATPNLALSGEPLILQGTLGHYVQLHKRMVNGDVPQTSDFYLSYTNVRSGGGSFDGAFNGNRAITAAVSGLQGFNPQTTTLKDFLEAVFYPSQPPTAALTITYSGTTSSNLQVEQMAAGAALPITLNWTAGRQAKTETISTVTVGGTSVAFTQPAPGSNTSGTRSTTANRNSTTSFTNVVTTDDNKTASATATISFLWRRYYGFVSGSSPSDADIRGLTSEFITGRTRGATAAQTPSGSQHFVIAFPESFDNSNVSQLWVGGLDQTGTFTRTVRSFTNASGGVTNYIIYVSNNPTSGSISFEIK